MTHDTTDGAAAPDFRAAFAAATQRTVQWIGAGASLGLLVGGLWWGWETLTREAAGVPVIQALDGPMRERPEDPGGRVIAHQGLAVNAVARGDGAMPVPASVVLAPPPEGLRPEDVARPAPEPVVAPRAEVIEVAMNGDDAAVAALARDLAADPAVGEPLVQAALADVIPADVPGVALSPRPLLRPASSERRAVPEATEVAAEAIPAGSLLAQIGTFADEDGARTEWTRLAAAHPGHMAGLDRVIQRRETGGRAWVRLRAAGFDGRPEAVRFCDAMLAAGVECVPVEAR